MAESKNQRAENKGEQVARNGLFYSERLVAAGQTIGAIGSAMTTAMAVAGSNEITSSTLCALPAEFAIAQGLFSIVNGVFVFLGKDRFYIPHGKWAPARNRARGIFEIVSGFCLAQGNLVGDAIEAGAKGFFGKDISLDLDSLYLRFAIYSISQFILTLGELYTYYQICKRTREHNPEWDRHWYRTMGKLMATALLSAAWVVLAVTKDIGNIAGFACFAGASALLSITYAPRFLSFLGSLCRDKTINDWTTHLSQVPEGFLEHPKPKDKYCPT